MPGHQAPIEREGSGQMSPSDEPSPAHPVCVADPASGPARFPRLRAKRTRLSTKALGAGVVSVGAALGAGAAFGPVVAHASCANKSCYAYAPTARYTQYSHEYGYFEFAPGYITQNHAHFYDCVQMYLSNGGGGKHYADKTCSYSPYITALPTASPGSQALAWRADGPTCSYLWAREEGHSLTDRNYLYGQC
jgi:hypothetical protein